MSAGVLEQAYICILVNVLWDAHAGMQGVQGKSLMNVHAYSH